MSGITLAEKVRKAGTWVDLTGTFVKDTAYQASTDGIIYGTMEGDGQIRVKTDSANPPTIERFSQKGVSNYRSVIAYVKKEEYYLIATTVANFISVFWQPLEIKVL